MKRFLLLCGLCLLFACGSDPKATAVSACLDRPTDLSRAPAGSLPCELIPPP